MAGIPLLSLRGISKQFGAVRALSGVDLEVDAGEVIALVGENGAGKSTLARVITGAGPADAGVVEWEGLPVDIRKPRDAQNLGIATVYQSFPLCDNLDVVDNLFLGRMIRRFGMLNRAEMERRSRELLDRLSIRIPCVRTPISSLTGGQRQMLAIARSLLGEPRLVILDEPSTALGVEQTGQVLNVIGRLREQNLGVILISHNLEEVRAVADRVAVLRLGRNNGFFEMKYATQEQIVSAITGDHAMGVNLQHSLLPRSLPEQRALEVAYCYLPAKGGVGGDWFDIIPLPGARVALIVGDVVGHGLHAAATMGRLRTAVHNFSSLDLSPDELLGHLDDLVTRIDQEDLSTTHCEEITGASCLYVIYDPVSGRCSLACAGHPPPVLVRPDGTAYYPDLPVGPPLGLGGLPFETAELHVPEGSQIVLYTDGLIEKRELDIDVGLELLRATLACRDRPPQKTCRAVLDALLPDRPVDDVALLVARTHVLAADQVADWDVACDPEAVSGIRTDVVERLEAWDMSPEVGFATELILSELVTNAIRYGSPPIHVRLLWDNTSLTCEVSDGSSTSPHLRHAATTDEGGRGLFLVAQLTKRWGTRYTDSGKVIWAEQSLPDATADTSRPAVRSA
ncbi:SpoIIE family protein phosphatase [Streptomyces shenzhenensis]|uniref:SpoIIE family protein phosphatase n=1 Tax=Streptomyces shenzhenensis TaxID=943815 RepID=UPI0036A51160